MIKFGFKTAVVFIDTLSAPAFKSVVISFISDIPPPTVRGISITFAIASTVFKKVFLFSCEAVISSIQSSSAPVSEYFLASVTGSPKVLIFLKLMPLTTLFFIISKQGMILTFNTFFDTPRDPLSLYDFHILPYRQQPHHNYYYWLV